VPCPAVTHRTLKYFDLWVILWGNSRSTGFNNYCNWRPLNCRITATDTASSSSSSSSSSSIGGGGGAISSYSYVHVYAYRS